MAVIYSDPTQEFDTASLEEAQCYQEADNDFLSLCQTCPDETEVTQ